MSSPRSASTDDALCSLAVDYATDGWLSAAQLMQISLSLSAMSLMAYVLCRNGCRRLVIHANFKIMVGNIMALYYMLCVTIVVMQVRFQVMYRTSQNPCDLLTPTWITVATRGPCYVYIVGFPLWHLAITLERAWSTLRVRTYEQEGVAYGICCAIAVWTFSILYTFYIVQLALEDPRFHEPNVYTTITTSTNANFLLNTQYALLAVDFFTSTCDFVVIVVNKKNLRRVSPAYSLSRSYQIHENISVTLRLVFPLDVCNTVLSVVFLVTTTIVRYYRHLLTPNRYNAIYEGLFGIVLLQASISLLILIHFLKTSKQTATVIDSQAQGEVYFRQFREQIGAGNAGIRLQPVITHEVMN